MTRLPRHFAPSVLQFYRETDWMFRVLAVLRGSTAMHAGLWPAGVQSHAAALATLNRTLVARTAIAEGQRVFDAGCGAGSCALWLAQHCKVQVLGVTLLPHQAQQARRAAERLGLHPRASFACLDYADSGLPDGIFDVVWAVESLCHAPCSRAFLQEAARLLRPGGRLIIADRFRSAQSANATDERQLRQWYEGWAFPGLLSVAQTLEDAAGASFHGLVAEEVTQLAWPSLRFLGQFAALSLPAALVLQGLRMQNAAQVAAIRGCVAQYATLKRGLWGYWILYGQR
jgi:tocopherol O-methyltransferase